MANWYERSFGSDYMVVYRHRNWEQAAREVETMAGWLELAPGASVLDIGCGMGRHALALAQLGYKVTGIDLSESLLQKARECNEQGHIHSLIQGDMRELPFEDGSFDATVNLFTSFGYFEMEADNHRVIREIRRVLKPRGAFLIDFMNPSYVAANLVPHSERTDELTRLHIREQRAIADGWVVKQIHITPQEGTEASRNYVERVRLFPLPWFEQALREAGLELEHRYGDYEGRPYEEKSSPRMILKGRALS
ncbi:class I SAM-dependent methyltransferase [Paenibacillus lignilyticus]|uniref:Methyltransferase domain-containing protein n=1 Tax=Paenibacillus lignilyticus TaxID=1172615 RepID=A0ABS5C860_9BACL|nr:class I SAM-dependent methyltransferase [Paenibacillus lignilyticus]MBP3962103.1 methyltransferase domain-containing protein [Paenibacillus lignilyticus]